MIPQIGDYVLVYGDFELVMGIFLNSDSYIEESVEKYILCICKMPVYVDSDPKKRYIEVAFSVK